MNMLLAPCLCLGMLAGQTETSGAFLYSPSFDIDGKPAGNPEPYRPQAGDIFLCTDRIIIFQLGHWLAGSGAPHHSGIVVALTEGKMGLLEAGPHNSLTVRLMPDLAAHLKSYEAVGERVWIRQRLTPLTPEQSKHLTAFAQAQNGKWFAGLRLVGQLTPFRSRGPVRTRWLGKPHGERFSYFCSELVTESCVAAGMLDGKRARPSATYPRELFFGKSTNPILNENLQINDGWLPPARLTCSVAVDSIKGAERSGNATVAFRKQLVGKKP
jgi:hypothetical protein